MSHPSQIPHQADKQTETDLNSLRSVQSALIGRITTLLVRCNDQGRISTLLSGLADLHDVTERLIAHGDHALKKGYDAYDEALYPLVVNTIMSVCAATMASKEDMETVRTLSKGYTTAYNAFEWLDARVSVKDCFERERRRTQAQLVTAEWAVRLAQAATEDTREAQASSAG